jgi:uncharacterized YigZ family protein
MEDNYKTIKEYSCDEFVEKRSRFIGYAKPVKTEAEALEFINKIKKEHWDARHNCYAYSLRENGIRRYSDDGEPQGTAGVPMLDVLNKNEIVDAVVVVTRYFGGVLLGTGGLIRAYTAAVKEALSVSETGIERDGESIKLIFPYNYVDTVKKYALSGRLIIDSEEYAENAAFNCTVRSEDLQTVLKELNDASNGRISVENLGHIRFLDKEEREI